MKILYILVPLIATLVIGCSNDKENSQEVSQQQSIVREKQKPKNQQTMPSKKNETSHNCPKCGAPGVPIIYGKPGRKLMERAKKKEIYLGGCCLMENSPSYHCYQCQIDFGS